MITDYITYNIFFLDSRLSAIKGGGSVWAPFLKDDNGLFSSEYGDVIDNNTFKDLLVVKDFSNAVYNDCLAIWYDEAKNLFVASATDCYDLDVYVVCMGSPSVTPNCSAETGKSKRCRTDKCVSI
jgi:hypothetical protein